MRRIVFEAQGTTPLIIQAMSDTTLIGLALKQRQQRKTIEVSGERELNEWLRAEAERQLYLDPLEKGRIGIPVGNFMSCLRDAGKGVKSGRAGSPRETVTNSMKQTVLYGFVFAQRPDDQDFLELTGLGAYDNLATVRKNAIQHKPVEKEGGSSWVVDVRKGNNPNGGEAVCLIRPMIPKWGFRMELHVQVGEYTTSLVRLLVDRAGQYTGLCGFRPPKGGRFGCFTITSWDETQIEGTEDDEAPAEPAENGGGEDGSPTVSEQAA